MNDEDVTYEELTEILLNLESSELNDFSNVKFQIANIASPESFSTNTSVQLGSVDEQLNLTIRPCQDFNYIFSEFQKSQKRTSNVGDNNEYLMHQREQSKSLFMEQNENVTLMNIESSVNEKVSINSCQQTYTPSCTSEQEHHKTFINSYSYKNDHEKSCLMQRKDDAKSIDSASVKVYIKDNNKNNYLQTYAPSCTSSSQIDQDDIQSIQSGFTILSTVSSDFEKKSYKELKTLKKFFVDQKKRILNTSILKKTETRTTTTTKTLTSEERTNKINSINRSIAKIEKKIENVKFLKKQTTGTSYKSYSPTPTSCSSLDDQFDIIPPQIFSANFLMPPPPPQLKKNCYQICDDFPESLNSKKLSRKKRKSENNSLPSPSSQDLNDSLINTSYDTSKSPFPSLCLPEYGCMSSSTTEHDVSTDPNKPNKSVPNNNVDQLFDSMFTNNNDNPQFITAQIQQPLEPTISTTNSFLRENMSQVKEQQCVDMGFDVPNENNFYEQQETQKQNNNQEDSTTLINSNIEQQESPAQEQQFNQINDIEYLSNSKNVNLQQTNSINQQQQQYQEQVNGPLYFNNALLQPNQKYSTTANHPQDQINHQLQNTVYQQETIDNQNTSKHVELSPPINNLSPANNNKFFTYNGVKTPLWIYDLSCHPQPHPINMITPTRSTISPGSEKYYTNIDGKNITPQYTNTTNDCIQLPQQQEQPPPQSQKSLSPTLPITTDNINFIMDSEKTPTVTEENSLFNGSISPTIGAVRFMDECVVADDDDDNGVENATILYSSTTTEAAPLIIPSEEVRKNSFSQSLLSSVENNTVPAQNNIIKNNASCSLQNQQNTRLNMEKNNNALCFDQNPIRNITTNKMMNITTPHGTQMTPQTKTAVKSSLKSCITETSEATIVNSQNFKYGQLERVLKTIQQINDDSDDEEDVDVNNGINYSQKSMGNGIKRHSKKRKRPIIVVIDNSSNNYHDSTQNFQKNNEISQTPRTTTPSTNNSLPQPYLMFQPPPLIPPQPVFSSFSPYYQQPQQYSAAYFLPQQQQNTQQQTAFVSSTSNNAFIPNQSNSTNINNITKIQHERELPRQSNINDQRPFSNITEVNSSPPNTLSAYFGFHPLDRTDAIKEEPRVNVKYMLNTWSSNSVVRDNITIDDDITETDETVISERNDLFKLYVSKIENCNNCKLSQQQFWSLRSALEFEMQPDFTIFIYAIHSTNSINIIRQPFLPGEVCHIYGRDNETRLSATDLFHTPNRDVGNFIFLALTIELPQNSDTTFTGQRCADSCFDQYKIIFPTSRYLRSQTRGKGRYDLYYGIFSFDDDVVFRLDLEHYYSQKGTSGFNHQSIREYDFLPFKETMKHRYITFHLKKSVGNKMSFLILPRGMMSSIVCMYQCVLMKMQLIQRTNAQDHNVTETTLFVHEDYVFQNKAHKLPYKPSLNKRRHHRPRATFPNLSTNLTNNNESSNQTLITNNVLVGDFMNLADTNI